MTLSSFWKRYPSKPAFLPPAFLSLLMFAFMTSALLAQPLPPLILFTRDFSYSLLLWELR